MYRCSQCNQGEMVPGFVDDYDMTPFFGLDARLVRAKALVCNRCGSATLEGAVVEAAERSLASLILRRTGPLSPKEVRFLRDFMGLSQADLGERLGVHRVSVSRWEADSAPVGALESFALRTMVAWHLGDAELARVIAHSPRLAPTSPLEPYRLETLAA
jgi:putative zinc finger/helix-turn-helix YgiT family protein